MWRVIAARIGSVALGRPLIVRASRIVPSLTNLQHAEPTSRCPLPNSNLRVALLGLFAGAMVSQPNAAECMPSGKRKATAPAAASAKKGTMHHDLKGSMEDGSLEHSLIATANS